MTVPAMARCDDLAGGNVECGKKRRNTMMAIVVRLSLGNALSQRNTRVVYGPALELANAYTLDRVMREERAVFDVAAALAEHQRDVQLCAPGTSLAEPSLDAQQRATYAHLASERDLAIVTEIAGAGKSRLQRDVAAAYQERVSRHRCGRRQRCGAHPCRRSLH